MSKDQQFTFSGFAVCVAFAQFPATKQKWKKDNPLSRITEEYTTLGMGNIEIPDTQLIGKTRTEQTIVMYWAIVFRTPIGAVDNKANA